MRESVVEKHLMRRVAETGGLIRKVQWIGHRGAPDRLVGWPGIEAYIGGPHMRGRHALIELKRPARGAEAHQQREHERLRAIGFEVWVLDTIEAVDSFVDGMTS